MSPPFIPYTVERSSKPCFISGGVQKLRSKRCSQRYFGQVVQKGRICDAHHVCCRLGGRTCVSARATTSTSCCTSCLQIGRRNYMHPIT